MINYAGLEEQFNVAKDQGKSIFGPAANAWNKTGLGQAAKKGFGEAFGMSYESTLAKPSLLENMGYKNMRSTGFLGWSGARVNNLAEKVFSSGESGEMGRLAKWASGGKKASYAYAAGKNFAKHGIGAALGLGFTAYTAYEGYQQEGIWGATKNIAESVAMQTAFTYAATALSGLVLPALTVAGAVAVGYAAYETGEAFRRKAKSMKRTEFSAYDNPDILNSAGVATARQRSLLALQNTHLNSRMVLGGEGQLLHR